MKFPRGALVREGAAAWPRLWLPRERTVSCKAHVGWHVLVGCCCCCCCFSCIRIWSKPSVEATVFLVWLWLEDPHQGGHGGAPLPLTVVKCVGKLDVGRAFCGRSTANKTPSCLQRGVRAKWVWPRAWELTLMGTREGSSPRPKQGLYSPPLEPDRCLCSHPPTPDSLSTSWLSPSLKSFGGPGSVSSLQECPPMKELSSSPPQRVSISL